MVFWCGCTASCTGVEDNRKASLPLWGSSRRRARVCGACSARGGGTPRDGRAVGQPTFVFCRKGHHPLGGVPPETIGVPTVVDRTQTFEVSISAVLVGSHIDARRVRRIGEVKRVCATSSAWNTEIRHDEVSVLDRGVVAPCDDAASSLDVRHRQIAGCRWRDGAVDVRRRRITERIPRNDSIADLLLRIQVDIAEMEWTRAYKCGG